MASEFCKIPPSNDTKTILDLLPPIPSINKVVELINNQVIVLKVQVQQKATDLVLEFADGICPSPSQIDKLIRTRNNLVNRLTKIYNKVERLSNTVSGVSNFLSLILTGIKIAGGLAQGIIVGTAIIPFPIPAAVNSVVEGAQGLIEKAKFKNDGSQRLTPLVGGLISANIAVKLFASALREVICTVEAIDASILECSTPQAEIEDQPITLTQEQSSRLQEIQVSLVPIPQEIISFIEQDVAEDEESATETSYRGFSFEIETIPFTPTVNRTRALALNRDGIALLQTELSFTSTPDILIQELKFIIDRDNLRAE